MDFNHRCFLQGLTKSSLLLHCAILRPSAHSISIHRLGSSDGLAAPFPREGPTSFAARSARVTKVSKRVEPFQTLFVEHSVIAMASCVSSFPLFSTLSSDGLHPVTQSSPQALELSWPPGWPVSPVGTQDCARKAPWLKRSGLPGWILGNTRFLESTISLYRRRLNGVLCLSPFTFGLEPDSETNRSDSETRVLKLGF